MAGTGNRQTLSKLSSPGGLGKPLDISPLTWFRSPRLDAGHSMVYVYTRSPALHPSL